MRVRDNRRDRPVLRVAGRLLGALIIIVTAALAVYVARMYYVFPQTDDAYVRANTVDVAPQVSGTIVELPVRDNQHVKAGDLLFVIDPRPYQAELDLAQARLALTNLQIEALNHAIGAAKARQKQTEADAAYDRQYLARIVPLQREDFVTANEVADARSKLAAARAATEQARNELGQAQGQLGQLGDINARRAEAQAELGQPAAQRAGIRCLGDLRGGLTKRLGGSVGVADCLLCARQFQHRRRHHQRRVAPAPCQLEPGLAKRDRLPPGLERQLRVRGTLPPGLRDRIRPCPEGLVRLLPPPPPHCEHVLIGGSIVLLNRNSFVVLDIFHLIG